MLRCNSVQRVQISALLLLTFYIRLGRRSFWSRPITHTDTHLTHLSGSARTCPLQYIVRQFLEFRDAQYQCHHRWRMTAYAERWFHTSPSLRRSIWARHPIVYAKIFNVLYDLALILSSNYNKNKINPNETRISVKSIYVSALNWCWVASSINQFYAYIIQICAGGQPASVCVHREFQTRTRYYCHNTFVSPTYERTKNKKKQKE